MNGAARAALLVVAGAAGAGALAVGMRRRRAASSPAPSSSSDLLPVGYTVPAGGFMLSQLDIVQAARDGRLEYRWRDLPGAPGVSVFEDAAKLEGLRVPVSARTTKMIAEILASETGENVLPTTPLVEDLIYDSADLRVKPVAFDTADPRSVAAFNASIEQQIAQQTGGRPGWGLVSCVGKSWVLSNMAIDHPGAAINYGFHWPLATVTGQNGPWPSVDGKSKVFQQPGARHNADHWDYSQTLRLCRLDAGASLPSHEPLRATKLWY